MPVLVLYRNQSIDLLTGFYIMATLALNELSVGDLIKSGSKIYSKLLKIFKLFKICICICQMPRSIDTVVLQRFVEEKRFLKKITKQGVLMRLEIQQKIQILTSRSGYYFTLLKTTICTPKLRILFKCFKIQKK